MKVALEPVDSVTVTTLVDNYVDMLLKAVHALAARFSNAFIQNSVGTRFEL